jgi:hypothetical protein
VLLSILGRSSQNGPTDIALPPELHLLTWPYPITLMLLLCIFLAAFWWSACEPQRMHPWIPRPIQGQLAALSIIY